MLPGHRPRIGEVEPFKRSWTGQRAEVCVCHEPGNATSTLGHGVATAEFLEVKAVEVTLRDA